MLPKGPSSVARGSAQRLKRVGEDGENTQIGGLGVKLMKRMEEKARIETQKKLDKRR